MFLLPGLPASLEEFHYTKWWLHIYLNFFSHLLCLNNNIFIHTHRMFHLHSYLLHSAQNRISFPRMAHPKEMNIHSRFYIFLIVILSHSVPCPQSKKTTQESDLYHHPVLLLVCFCVPSSPSFLTFLFRPLTKSITDIHLDMNNSVDTLIQFTRWIYLPTLCCLFFSATLTEIQLTFGQTPNWISLCG